LHLIPRTSLCALQGARQGCLADFDAAQSELDLLKSARNLPAVMVARAALAVERAIL